jgi:hypothetical protein
VTTPSNRRAPIRRRGMPDGQSSAATIEYEDIGEPEDHRPQQA